MRNTAGPSSRNDVMYSANDATRMWRSPAGTSPGRSVVWTMIQAMKLAASKNPGMNPAVNSLAIETSPSTP